MAVSEMDFVDVLASIGELSVSQTYKVMLAMKEVPAEGTDVLKEAMVCFEALTDLEVYQFFKLMRERYDDEEWSALTED